MAITIDRVRQTRFLRPMSVAVVAVMMSIGWSMSALRSSMILSQPRELSGTSAIARAAFSADYLFRLQQRPAQVHLSLAGPNQIRVCWVTESGSSPSRVEYGTRPGSYDSFADGTVDHYKFLLYQSGYVHNVVVGPLEPDTIYYYRCGGAGTEYSFKTPPPAGPQVPITFAVAGDLGQTNYTTSTLSHIQNSDYDVLILPGDLSYADYYQPLWDSFGKLVEPLASSRPWMVTQGNHEVERIPLVVESFRSYNTRWQMPYKESGSDSNLYYSFEVAGVHVSMLGSYADYSRDSNQYKWLQADLAKVDRSKTPWLVAVIHAPWYNSNAKHQGEGEGMMKSMELILKEAKVDLIFAGHVHAYERTMRVFQGQSDSCGIVHITIGDGGNREGLANTFLDPKPAWSAYREATYGHGKLRIVNATHAHWSWQRNQDPDVVVGDQLWLRNMADPSYSCES